MTTGPERDEDIRVKAAKRSRIEAAAASTTREQADTVDRQLLAELGISPTE
jgi:hypothetical protein